MASLFPREEHAEALFHRILSNPGAEQQLYETFCMEQENASFEDGGGAECSFAKALLQAYENRDISALTIALCCAQPILFRIAFMAKTAGIPDC